ncbi:MAG TPA: diguanylate cyclase [Treponemataceae bacterium]|nr:diguanylate cyclase [Treponemataceae bacterium]
METQIQSIAHLVVSLYAGVLFFEGVRRRRDIDRFSYVSIVNAGLASWNFLLFLYYGLDNPDTVYLVSQWGFVSVNSTIFGLFFFAWRISFGRKHDHLLPFFAVVPVVNCLLSITSKFQPLFLSGHRGFQFFPLRELTIIKGPWFIVHAVYSYLLLTLSLTLLVILYFRAIKKNRAAKLLFVVSAMTFSIFLFLTNFTSLKSAIQPYAFIGHLFCVSIFYWATFLDEDDSVVYFGIHRFYDTVGMPVLIFNDGGELLHYNDDARRYFEQFNASLEKYNHFGRIFDGSFLSGGTPDSASGDDRSFFAQNTQNAQTLYVGWRDIVNRRNVRIGYALILYDISRMGSFVKDLEKRAYTDELCQCKNRNCFEQQRQRILEDSPRPLVLFIADIDNLKAVNDQWGHSAGDDYIRSCVAIMKKVTRTTDFLYRIGGDEFAFFIPGLDEAGIVRVQQALESELAALHKEFPCSLSVGYSVFEAGDSDFEKHFNRADKAMYAQKKQKNRG